MTFDEWFRKKFQCTIPPSPKSGADDFYYMAQWDNMHKAWKAARRETLKEIVQYLRDEGIDKDECEAENGWWETSYGAAYGEKVLMHIENMGELQLCKRYQEVK